MENFRSNHLPSVAVLVSQESRQQPWSIVVSKLEQSYMLPVSRLPPKGKDVASRKAERVC